MTKKEMIIETLITNIEEGKVKGPVGIAKFISQLAHTGQRRDNGHGYYVHPRNCVRLFYDLVSIDGSINGEILTKYKIPYGVIEVAYLHDVVEDTELTHQDIRDIFKEVGEEQVFDEYIDVPLELITHDKKEDYDKYIQKVLKHPVSSLVKMLDLSDNMNLFGLSVLGGKELERAIKYAKYFKTINDEWHFLETLKNCYVDIVCAWNS